MKDKWSVSLVGFLFALILGGITFAQTPSSSHYQIPKLVENQGSGFRIGSTYQVTGDTISEQPVEISTSDNYILKGRPLVTVESASPTGGITINHGDEATSTLNVNLQCGCGHPSGCAQMMFSNNGVGWSAAEPYSTAKAWALAGSDGTRKVFAKFKSGGVAGSWSGPVWDTIQLDTTAPTASISPTGGTYFESQSVAVTASEPGTIKYTTDGSDPKTSPTAQLYSGPVTVDHNLTFKAFATDLVGFQSPVVSETYEVCAGSNLGISGKVLDATRQNAPMPLVVITLDSGHTANTDLNGNYAFTGLPRG